MILNKLEVFCFFFSKAASYLSLTHHLLKSYGPIFEGSRGRKQWVSSQQGVTLSGERMMSAGEREKRQRFTVWQAEVLRSFRNLLLLFVRVESRASYCCYLTQTLTSSSCSFFLWHVCSSSKVSSIFPIVLLEKVIPFVGCVYMQPITSPKPGY